MIINLKKGESPKIESSKNESAPVMIAKKTKQLITKPEVIQEIKRIESAEKLTVKEKLRLNRLKKYGDKATAKNKCIHKEKKDPVTINLAQLNKNPEAGKDELHTLASKIIDDIFNGLNPIEAINKHKSNPKQFYTLLDKIEFSEEKKQFNRARECYAESCIYEQHQLRQMLLAGDIDSSTYSAISNDLKFLASKFFPKAYGDKISLESDVRHTVTHQASPATVAQLNSLLNGGLLENKSAIDAEFEEV